ncbi:MULTISPECIES: ABC transporter permease [Symbiopectobacterium]|uniref:ABC transporter permease n=1 Tax=Symbiopectobacterium TaxID=801 RepID=UPI0020792B54|nr:MULTISPECIES: ABC transporter permease subunit [Symbiopectobacterium]
MRSLGANRNQIFRKVVVPSTLPWIIATFRLNIGFALIADIGGEFISSDYGLGKMIFVAGNLFNLNVVWVGVFTLLVVAIVLYLVVVQLQTLAAALGASANTSLVVSVPLFLNWLRRKVR